MADALATITKFISSPPGVNAAGGVLAGIVWKFFERVEALLTPWLATSTIADNRIAICAVDERYDLLGQ
jgi:hypothetical protein